MARRKGKAQPIARNTGAVPYGVGEALADAQREMPVPNGPGAAPSAPARPAGPPPAGPTGGGGMADAIAAAALMAPPAPGGLAAPTNRPDEPVTAGLPIGPGPGPGALGVPLVPEEDETLKTLMLVFQRSGDPEVGRLIELVRARADRRRRTLAAGRSMPALNPAERRPI